MSDLPDRWPESVRPFWEALDQYQRRAAHLLVLSNAAADAEFKRRYARRWWTMLEERCRLAAMTSPDLVRFTGQLARRLGGQVGRNADDRAAWRALVSAGDDACVLDALDHDAAVLVAFVRALSEARLEAAEAAAAFERGEELTTEQEQLL
ncbi:MAG TPA: hypothetical protein VF192_01505 [Longimicrobiales bacterium]